MSYLKPPTNLSSLLSFFLHRITRVHAIKNFLFDKKSLGEDEKQEKKYDVEKNPPGEYE
jgi:hypothetical protein